MDSGRRGFFKRLIGLGALAVSGQVVGKSADPEQIVFTCSSSSSNYTSADTVCFEVVLDEYAKNLGVPMRPIKCDPVVKEWKFSQGEVI